MSPVKVLHLRTLLERVKQPVLVTVRRKPYRSGTSLSRPCTHKSVLPYVEDFLGLAQNRLHLIRRHSQLNGLGLRLLFLLCRLAWRACFAGLHLALPLLILVAYREYLADQCLPPLPLRPSPDSPSRTGIQPGPSLSSADSLRCRSRTPQLQTRSSPLSGFTSIFTG